MPSLISAGDQPNDPLITADQPSNSVITTDQPSDLLITTDQRRLNTAWPTDLITELKTRNTLGQHTSITSDINKDFEDNFEPSNVNGSLDGNLQKKHINGMHPEQLDKQQINGFHPDHLEEQQTNKMYPELEHITANGQLEGTPEHCRLNGQEDDPQRVGKTAEPAGKLVKTSEDNQHVTAENDENQFQPELATLMDDEKEVTEGGVNLPMGPITLLDPTAHIPTTNGSDNRLRNFEEDTPYGPPKRSSLGVKIGGSDEDLEDNTDFARETHVVPPDGGWGWVVAVASFMCNVMVDGIIFTTGMLLDPIMKEFDVSYAQVSWVSSLLGGCYLLAGPFVSSLANAYGFRTVCIIGAVSAACASWVSYFASNIYCLYFSYGILAGVGFGFIYVPAVIATGFYFEKRRALATGIAVCGSGIGTFILAPVDNYILSTSWGWRGVLLVNGCLILTCAFYALAFRPLSAATGKVVAVDEDPANGTPLLMRIKVSRDAQLKACLSDASLQSAVGVRPPSRQVMESEKPTLGGVGNGVIDAKDMKGINPSIVRVLQQECLTKRNSYPDVIMEQTGPADTNKTAGDAVPLRSATSDSLRLDGNKNETVEVPVKTKYRPTRSSGCTRNESAPSLSVYKGAYRPSDATSYRRSSRVSMRVESSRPFYRDDAFYSGSLARLPQYISSESIEQYHASVIRIPQEILEEEDEDGSVPKSCCGGCPTSAKTILFKMFDLSLFVSPTFIVLLVAGFMSLLGVFVPFNFLPSFITAEQKALGLKDDEVEQTKTFLMSLIGICNTIGRVICGWVSDHPKVDAIVMNNVALILGGIATCLIPFISNVSLLYLYAMVFGFSIAVFASLRSILLVELLGLDKLTNAFGLLLLCQGFAALIGSPVAGAIADYTGDFNISFYVLGAIYALSGAICIPIRKVKEWETKRQEAQQKQKTQDILL